MSSATSTEPSTSLVEGPSTSPGAAPAGASFRPWQFFLLAGMLAATATVVVATGQSPASIILLSLTILAASLVGFTVYRTLLPLVSPEAVEAPPMVAGRTRVALEREKTLALRAIKELEFDFAMGKVAQGDFDEMTGRLRGRALRLMRELEAGTGYRGVIEKELASRIGAAPGSEAPGFSRAAPGVSRAITPRSEPSGSSRGSINSCASCGTRNDPDARFCKNCGAKLNNSSPSGTTPG